LPEKAQKMTKKRPPTCSHFVNNLFFQQFSTQKNAKNARKTRKNRGFWGVFVYLLEIQLQK